jgi:uncharacterized membrane protein (UPF0127 family)
MTRFAPLLALAALVTACAAKPAPAPNLFPALGQARVTVTTSTGKHEFDVWIAADDRSREQGLMHVRELPADRGMLFLFERPQPIAFWMKDTYLSLDLVFIDPAGRVVNVAADAEPLSLRPIRSRGEAVAVLELLAGTASRIGLQPGDEVGIATLRTTGRPDQGPARPRQSPRRG